MSLSNDIRQRDIFYFLAKVTFYLCIFFFSSLLLQDLHVECGHREENDFNSLPRVNFDFRFLPNIFFICFVYFSPLLGTFQKEKKEKTGRGRRGAVHSWWWWQWLWQWFGRYARYVMLVFCFCIFQFQIFLFLLLFYLETVCLWSFSPCIVLSGFWDVRKIGSSIRTTLCSPSPHSCPPPPRWRLCRCLKEVGGGRVISQIVFASISNASRRNCFCSCYSLAS